MFRRVIATLAALAYLAGQATVAVHAHADAPAGHSAQRHVHLGKTPAAGHGHSHHHHASHLHSHDGSCDSLAKLPTAPAPHDQDTVSLPETDAVATGSQAQSPDVNAADCLDCVNLISVATEVQSNTLVSETPPAHLRGGIDLCLTLRTLRI